jgi:hypothetical protein
MSSNTKTFYPFVGSLADYQQNLTNVLGVLKTGNPDRTTAIEWMVGEYGASWDFCRKVFDALRHIELITYSERRFSLLESGEEYLETGESDIVVSALIDNVLGIQEMFDILEEDQVAERISFLEKWRTRIRQRIAVNQFDHRVNWLRGMGYVDMVAKTYLLTNRGLKFVAAKKQRVATTIDEQIQLSHHDLEGKLKIIGDFFEFETTTRPSINVALPSYALKLSEGDRMLDCLWVRYVHFAGNIKFPIEIHLSGNLADALDRLETVSDYVQKAIIITNEEQEKKILDRLKVKRSRLLSKLVIIGVSDVYKAFEATSVLRSFTERLFAE